MFRTRRLFLLLWLAEALVAIILIEGDRIKEVKGASKGQKSKVKQDWQLTTDLHLTVQL